MKILCNNKIRVLFNRIMIIITLFSALSITFTGLGLENAAIYVLISSLCMCLTVIAVCYGYFKEQNRIMETAVEQIKDYISGNKNARIDSNEEGELYRLFHEVNSLVSILNAHAENEGRAKLFLKDTISDISHQLKTPLTALNIYNGIIQEEAKELPTIKEFTDFSEQELDRIQTLVQNLLNIAKFDSGTIVLEKNTENVSEMMEGVRKRFLYRAIQEEKEIILKGDETLTFLCDRNWLTEAFGNIVKNALDHTGRGGLISIEWELSVDTIQIMVKDNGCGIHPEDLYFIFKRFYRSRYSKDIQGIGLGLPLAKAIIEIHNGTVRVESEPGSGTAFIINFPA